MEEAKRYDFNPYDGEAGMEESPDGEYVRHEDYLTMKSQRDQANLRWYEEHRRIWKEVVSTDVYQDLKHGKFRDIMNLLADGEISIGKAAESIAERAGGIEPRLPARTYLDDEDLSWKERYDALRLLAFDAKIDIAYALKVGYKADDCGDHCHVECYWCQLRESLKKLEDAGV